MYRDDGLEDLYVVTCNVIPRYIHGRNRKRFVAQFGLKWGRWFGGKAFACVQVLRIWPAQKVLFKVTASPDQSAKLAMAPTTKKTGTIPPSEHGSRINHCSGFARNVFLCEGAFERDGCIDEIDRPFSLKKYPLWNNVLISRHCRWHEQRTCCPTSRTSSPSITQKGSSFYKDKSRPIPHQRSVRVWPLPIDDPDDVELLHMRNESLNCWGTTRIREHANLQRNAYESFAFHFWFCSWELF